MSMSRPGNRRQARLRQKSGAVTVMVALALLLMLGCIGLCVDIGFWYYNWSLLQTAADTAAIAGASDLPDASTGATAARTLATLNGALASEITTSRPLPVGSANPNQYEVVLRRTTSAFFSSVVGLGSITISVRSVAQLDSSSGSSQASSFPSTSPFYNVIYSGRKYQSGSSPPLDNFVWAQNSGAAVNGYVQVNGNFDGSAGAGNFNSPVNVVGSITKKKENFNAGSTPGAPYINPAAADTSKELAAAKAAQTYYKKDSYGAWWQWSVATSSWTSPAVAPADASLGSSLDFNVNHAVVNGTYYVTGAGITISASGLSGSAVFVCDGDFACSSSNVSFDPTTAFGVISLATDSKAISITGSNCTIYGAFWAPIGGIYISAANLDLEGGLFADNFDSGINGANATIDYNFNQIKQIQTPPPIKYFVHLVQ